MPMDDRLWQARGRYAYASDLAAGLPTCVSADSAHSALIFLYFNELGALPVEETEYALALAIGGYLQAHREWDSASGSTAGEPVKSLDPQHTR